MGFYSESHIPFSHFIMTSFWKNSYNVEIHDIDLYRSGFWNLHILYSHDVLVHNVSIRTIDKESPSTDGIDIDSSYNVLGDGCFIDCFDDSICIKSGRDYDGLLTNIACHDVEIKNCTINKGFGITIGSEISGGAYNINIHDIKYNNTDCGFRIKSSTSRKGYIKNISIANFELLNVKYVFNIMTSWNPLYNKIEIKDGIEMKEEWKNILHEVDESIPNTIIDGIYVSNIKSRISDDYKGISRLFNIVGFDDMPIKNISIKKLDSISKEYGIIKNAEVSIIDSNIRYDVVLDEDNNEFDNR